MSREPRPNSGIELPADEAVEAEARERLSREVEELPADEAVESEAHARQEAESKEVLPTSAAALVQATLGEAGEGVMSALRIRFARAEDDRVLVLLYTIEQRLERFLGSAAKPSTYAEAVVNLSGNATEPSTHTHRTVAEFQTILVAELNPLLHELLTHLVALPASDVHTPDDLLTLLQAGEVHNQKTTSLFGVLHQLSAQFPNLPALHLDASQTPQRIVVVQPLDPQFTPYWKERLACREVYGETTLPELVALRSNTAIITLHDAAEQCTTPEQEETKRACLLLAAWMEEQIPAFQEERACKPEELAFLVRRLHFGRGNPDEVIDLLNAAEQIKQTQPELYVRLCGIASAYNHGSNGTTEAGRSDLFGNVFQIALARSLEVRVPTNSTMHALFHQRMEGLTRLDHTQQLLHHLNEEQLRQIERNIRSLQTDATAGTPAQRATSGVFALLASKMYFEASLPRLLEEIQSTEWEEDRERLLQRLRVAGPTEFLQLLKEVPTQTISRHGRPPLLKILDKDFADSIDKRVFQLGNVAIDGPHMLITTLKNSQEWMRTKGVWDELVDVLWKTAGDEALLSTEFFRYIQNTLSAHDSKWVQGRFQVQSKKERMGKICHVLAAHPNITEQEWLDWRDMLERKATQNLLNVPIQEIGAVREIRSWKDVLQTFEEKVGRKDIMKTPTHFFRMLPTKSHILHEFRGPQEERLVLLYRLHSPGIPLSDICVDSETKLLLNIHFPALFAWLSQKEQITCISELIQKALTVDRLSIAIRIDKARTWIDILNYAHRHLRHSKEVAHALDHAVEIAQKAKVRIGPEEHDPSTHYARLYPPTQEKNYWYFEFETTE